MKKIETTLPIFRGFYGNFWESLEDDNLENEIQEINNIREENGLPEISLDDINYDDIDYAAHRKKIAEDCCEFVRIEMNDFIFDVEFLGVDSPTYYNYRNDYIDCVITYNSEAISKYIYKHKEEFTKFLKDNFTSYDGFWSYYSNKFEDWEKASNNFTDFDSEDILFSSILNFIASTENITEENMYYAIEGYLSINNIEKYYTLEFEMA